MRKHLVLLITIFLFTSCSQNKRELYEITDSFVESLDTKFESYGIQGEKYSKKTTDGKYRVIPIGRLINVKIMEVVEDLTYEDLREDFTNHYDNDNRVNKVYINNLGTIMIDCRN
ncbi:hypothetical protein [uncultured Winogradskyella sp.]|uniref:hypothetical protein n=1 Tax=uncultured Winogradskyella sp. TaxID=395353 RepID=UPI00260F69ED|nr:hypothetical protein [uncultured Winogradskyella sp.]